ncbi:MAG: translocation/assembly module TamB domain-containing protein, partial [Deltaproteobacteria bacterium]|nr:translocation/assembly module TamB domain-containing protein [Deltaproteobacteria bacterium]
GGKWNLLEALSARVPSPPSKRTFTIVVDSAQVQAGALQITLAENRPTYRITKLYLDSEITLPASGMSFKLRRFAANLGAAGIPPLYIAAALEYNAVTLPAALHLTELDLRTQQSTISTSGSLLLAQMPRIDVVVVLERLAAADIAQIFPASPLKADVAGRIALLGPENALHGSVSLNAAGAIIDGTADADATQKEPPYAVKLKLSNANLQRLVKISSVGGLLDVSLDAHGGGSSTAALAAKIQAQGHGLTAEQYPLGTMDLSAAVADKNLRATLTLAAPAGYLAANGTSSIAPNPAYHVDLIGRRLNAARAGIKQAVATDLNFQGTIDDRGLKPATANTRVMVNVKRSKLGPLSLDRGIFDVRIADNRADLRRVHLEAEQSALDLHGFVGIAGAAPLKCSYRLYSSNVKGLLALWKISGGGRLDIDGTIAGRRSALRTSGHLAAESLQTAGYSIHHGAARYDFSLTGIGAPFGNLELSMNGVKAGTELSAITVALDAAPGTPKKATLRLNVHDSAGRNDQLAADFIYRPQLLSGRLTQLSLGLPDGEWQLMSPVEFRESRAAVSMSRLQLQNGASELVFAGTLARQGSQNFSASARHFELSALAPLARRWHNLHGILSANLRVVGTSAAPAVALGAQANGLGFEKQPVGQFSATVNYLNDHAVVSAVLRQNAQDFLTIEGSVPVELSWANGVKAKIGEHLDLTVHSTWLNLAPMARLFPDEVRNFRGTTAINLRLRGSPTHPEATGSFSIAGVHAEVIPLGVTISEMHAIIGFRPGEIRVQTLQAHAGHGTISGRGTIELAQYTPSALGLTVAFDKWPAINTQEYTATIGGLIAATGTLAKPQVNGQIEVLNGTIRPDIAFLAATSNLTPDNTITVVQPGQKAAPAMLNAGVIARPPPAPASSSFNNLGMKVAVIIHRNTWIRHPDASAELQGKLDVSKAPGGPIRVSGEIRTVRGWLNYQNRRFTLQTGVLTFTGGEQIDPELDIDAQYLVTNYTIDILVGGTASKPTLKLQSQPQLAQSDILSLLLFGKTTDALGQNQQASLQQTAAQMATGVAVSQIGEAVASSLGLQSLGIELNDVSTSGGSMGFGHYLGQNTYVSASSSVGSGSSPTAGSSGQKISVQYFILRWLSVTTSTDSDGSHEIDLNIVKQY